LSRENRRRFAGDFGRNAAPMLDSGKTGFADFKGFLNGLVAAQSKWH
jgi:hypothetical protein